MCRSEKQIQTAICFSVSWVFHISCRTTTTYSNALAHHYHHPCSPRTNTRLKLSCTWPIQRLVINHVGLNLTKAAKTCQAAVLRCLLDGYACYSSREMRTVRVYQLRSFICCVTFIRRPFDLARSYKLKDLLFCFAFLYSFRYCGHSVFPSVSPAETETVIELPPSPAGCSASRDWTCTQVWPSLHSIWICTVLTHTLSALYQFL